MAALLLPAESQKGLLQYNQQKGKQTPVSLEKKGKCCNGENLVKLEGALQAYDPK